MLSRRAVGLPEAGHKAEGGRAVDNHRIQEGHCQTLGQPYNGRHVGLWVTNKGHNVKVNSSSNKMKLATVGNTVGL